VNDLIEAIHYQSTSPAAGSKTINYALTDAELETVNQSLALTITSSSNIITGTNDDDFLVGTSGDDLIQPLDATPEVGDTIVASGGNDEIDFAGSVDGFYNVNYHTLGVGIDATIGVTTASLIKSGIGTDTWSNVDQINGNAGGVTLRTSSQNDTFNVDTTGLEWLALRVGGGTDTITRTGTGTLRVDLRGYNGVTVDATTNTATEIGGSSTTTVTGFVNEWRGSAGDDTFLGSGSNERFITQGGVNVIDGGGSGVDTDLLRYDRFFVDQGGGSTNILVQMNGVNSGTVTGTWFGQFFTDTFTDIEQIRGSQVGVTQFVGASGNDEFYGVGGANYFEGNGGDDLFVAGGDANIFAFEFDPGGFGTDTIRNFVVGRDLIDAIEQGPPGTYTITYDGVSGNSTVVTAGGTIIIEGVDITGVPLGDIFVENENMSATGGDDNLSGTSQNDKIDGEAGNDTINGNDGNDILLSGGATLDFNGFDVLRGGAGDDVLVSQGGASLLRGEQGNDILIATDEFSDGYWDWVRADYSNSPAGIIANLTSGTPTSGPGGTPPSGIPGPMQVADGWGTVDTISGIHLLRDSNNDDFIYVDDSYVNNFGNFFEARLSGGNDFVDFTGMTGTARISWQNAEDGVIVSIDNDGNGTATDNNSNPANNTTDEIGTDTFIGANYVRGSNYADVFNGSDNNDRFRGSAGDDTINGGFGNDRIDHSDSPNGIDVDLALGSNQVIDDGFGTTDTLTSIESVGGSEWADTIRGDGNDNVLSGGHGDDLLEGRGGDDQLYDGNDAGGLLGGDDTLIGGTGNDFMRGGDGADTYVFASGDGNDTIDDFNFADGDRIDITAYGFASTAEFTIDTTSNPGNTIIDFNGTDTVTLNGVDLTAIGNVNDAFIFSTSGPSFIQNWAFAADLSQPADSVTDTSIRWTNVDGTITELFGSGFAPDVNGDPTGGNVEGMRRFDTDGTTLLEEYDLGTPSSVALLDLIGVIQDADTLLTELRTPAWGLDSVGDVIEVNEVSPTQIDLGFANGQTLRIIGTSLDLQSDTVSGFGTINQIQLIDSDGSTVVADTVTNLGAGLGIDTATLIGIFNAGAFEEITLYGANGSVQSTGTGAGIGFGGIEYWLLEGQTTFTRTSAFTEGVSVVQGFGDNNTIIDNSPGAITVNVTYFNSPTAVTATLDTDLLSAPVTGTVARGDGSGGSITDTITGVREPDGSIFGDVIIGTDDRDSIGGGEGDDTITLNGGNDDVIWSPGEGADTITDFQGGAGESDRVVLQEVFQVYNIESLLRFADDSSNVIGGASNDTVFDFGGGESITLADVTLANLVEDDFFIDNSAVIEGTDGDDVLQGNDGNNVILTKEATPGFGDVVIVSGGDDIIDFAGAINGFYNLDYTPVGPGSLTVNFGTGADSTVGTIVKDTFGTDTLYNLDEPGGDGGIFLGSGSGDDTFNLNMTDIDFLAVRVGGGDDTITRTAGTGFLRVDVRSSGYDGGATIDANLTTGTVVETGDPTGPSVDVSGFVNEWRLTRQNDVFTGTSSGERIITERGDDTVNAGGGIDTVRYDRGGVVDVNVTTTALNTHTVTGTWDGQSFTDTLNDVEIIRGANSGIDTFNGSSNAETFDGRGGSNIFIGGGGNDVLKAGGNFNLFVFDTTTAGTAIIENFDADRGDLIDLTGYGLGSTPVRTFVPNADPSLAYTSLTFGSYEIRIMGQDLTDGQFDQLFIIGGVNFEIGTSFDDNFTGAGTTGTDYYLPGTNDEQTFFGDNIYATSGDDFINFTGGTDGFYNLFYNSLDGGAAVPITVTINPGDIDGTIEKGVSGANGTDTLLNIDQIGNGLWVRASSQDDVFNVDTTEVGFFIARVGGGNDDVNVSGTGALRVDLREYNAAGVDGVIVDANQTTNTAVAVNAGSTWNVDVTGFVSQWRGSSQNDSFLGTSGDEVFRAEGGDDVIRGAGGNDFLQGDGGADRFVFVAGDGNDTIGDFNFADGDRIDVVAYGFSSSGDFDDGFFDGTNTILNFNGIDTVTVRNVDLTALTNPDDAFIFT
jgi:Ca2+-binding RTX toxin-like protein